MAFSFVVEDGSGVAGATSYASLDDADDYLSIKPTYSLWEAVADQEYYLAWATRLLDQRAVYNGTKADTGGSLRWPRVGVVDRDGVSISYDELPLALKAATIEIAFHLATQNVDPSTPVSTSGEIKRIKADVLEIEYVDGTQSSTVNYFPLGINDILRGLGSVSTGSGSRFANIKRV